MSSQIIADDRVIQVPDPAPGYKTTELWTIIVFLIKNFVVLLALLGWVSEVDKESLTTLLTAFAGSVGMAVAEGLAIWKYIQSRSLVKEAQAQLVASMVASQTPYRHILVERLDDSKE